MFAVMWGDQERCSDFLKLSSPPALAVAAHKKKIQGENDYLLREMIAKNAENSSYVPRPSDVARLRMPDAFSEQSARELGWLIIHNFSFFDKVFDGMLEQFSINPGWMMHLSVPAQKRCFDLAKSEDKPLFLAWMFVSAITNGHSLHAVAEKLKQGHIFPNVTHLCLNPVQDKDKKYSWALFLLKKSYHIGNKSQSNPLIKSGPMLLKLDKLNLLPASVRGIVNLCFKTSGQSALFEQASYPRLFGKTPDTEQDLARLISSMHTQEKIKKAVSNSKKTASNISSATKRKM